MGYDPNFHSYKLLENHPYGTTKHDSNDESVG
jgi:hypothetical protein